MRTILLALAALFLAPLLAAANPSPCLIMEPDDFDQNYANDPEHLYSWHSEKFLDRCVRNWVNELPSLNEANADAMLNIVVGSHWYSTRAETVYTSATMIRKVLPSYQGVLNSMKRDDTPKLGLVACLAGFPSFVSMRDSNNPRRQHVIDKGLGDPKNTYRRYRTVGDVCHPRFRAQLDNILSIEKNGQRYYSPAFFPKLFAAQFDAGERDRLIALVERSLQTQTASLQ